MEKQSEFIKQLETTIMKNNSWSDKTRKELLINFWMSQGRKMNLMITGATGCGKSSTINAIFNEEIADVGIGSDPETMEIRKYEQYNLILWDTPGLGDGREADVRHTKNIIKKLNETDKNGEFLIDLVLVILDGSSRDLGTSYDLINKVIVPNLGKEKDNRILVAINQADMAMKGQHWDYRKNMPDEVLKTFLDKKVQSVHERIKEGTGLDIIPVYYSAGYKVPGEKQCVAYNLSELLYRIMKQVPEKKRKAKNTEVNKKVVQNKNKSTKTIPVTTAYSGGILVDIIDGISDIVDGCYITTAICEEFGKPDDCYELITLRNFRDHWLINQPDGKELIQRYYNTAPEIVAIINRRKDRKQIYQNLRDTYLYECLKQISLNENEKCKKIYIAMMEELSKKKLAWELEEKVK